MLSGSWRLVALLQLVGLRDDRHRFLDDEQLTSLG